MILIEAGMNSPNSSNSPSRRPAWVKAEYERIGRERDEASRWADRFYRWELVRVCARMFGWTVLGLVPAAFAFHVNDRDLGKILLYTGMIITASGILWTIASAYRRGEERGDW
ncbi:MAG: hypothetical protein ACHQWU_13550 [Gemmatimonadales bacterium]|jgi:hypothetical protein